MFKKYLAGLLSAFLLLFFSGCGKEASEGSEKLRIVCTIFPAYDWTINILGEEAENAEVTLLLDNGVDLHNYVPTVSDIAKIGEADLFVYVDGESDHWVEEVLAEAPNPNRQTIALLKTAGAKEEVIVEGMEEHEEGGEEEHEEGPEYDEHVWLSLKCARTIVTAMGETLAGLRPEKGDLFRENAQAYCAALEELDGKYQEAVAEATQSTLIFADRFPFRYLADDYGLSYFAAFPGCSAETEASFETVAFLAAKADELNVSALLVIESSDGAIARTVADNMDNKDVQVLTLNSCQSVTEEQIRAGASYKKIMEENLLVLKRALS